MNMEMNQPTPAPAPRPPGLLRRFVSVLGPGLVSGAADDDPSRIATYSIAGAQLGAARAMLASATAAIHIGRVWGSLLRGAFIPSTPRDSQGWGTLVAILGTTISPYLFFWQSSQEVEEEKAMGRRMLRSRLGATRQEIDNRKIDVGVGAFFSNLVMFFII